MLFNSYEFLFGFLPCVLLGFHWLSARGASGAAIAWLALASLFFYGWWNPPYLLLLLGSIGFNYGVGRSLGARSYAERESLRRLILTVGIWGNLGAIGYFKYAGFLSANLSLATGLDITISHVVLPLAISFFTFQQIAYLVDCYRGVNSERSLARYILFVSFFPQLIAGPIVHHGEMMPQFRPRTAATRLRGIHVGLLIFAIGLFKKAVLADGVATYANPIFAMADSGGSPQFFDAWGGVLAYTFQLYFDFSGYSDMAIGAARMFGIRLPLNFHSPYKATSIIDFWRRWHMTLSRFLRDYLYIPLGGGRSGRAKRYRNLMITMLLGGLWHGAGWTFVAWGGLHGAYLIVNLGWRTLVARIAPLRSVWPSRGAVSLAWLVTFLCVVVGWAFFRSTTFGGAIRILEGMAGMNGVSLPAAVAARIGQFGKMLQTLGVGFTPGGGSVFLHTWLWNATLMVAVLSVPNTQELLAISGPDRTHSYQAVAASNRGAIRWRNRRVSAVAAGILLALGTLALPQVSEFLYFRF